jgi:hypothetical protein
MAGPAPGNQGGDSGDGQGGPAGEQAQTQGEAVMSAKRLRPLKAVRAQCLICMGGKSWAVEACPSQRCLLYPFRRGHGGRVPLRLMRSYCLHCCGWPLNPDGPGLDPAYKDGGQGEARRESRACTGKDCPFFAYRPGTRPFPSRPGSKTPCRPRTAGHFPPLEPTQTDPAIGGPGPEAKRGPAALSGALAAMPDGEHGL